MEHISDCGKELYGVSDEAAAWFEEMRLVLLSEGFGGMERELMTLRKGLKTKRRKAVNSLLRYLEGNRDRMNYCERVDRVNKIAVIVAAIDSNQWNALWKIPIKV